MKIQILKKVYSIIMDYSSLDRQIEKFRELARSCRESDASIKNRSTRGVILER